MFKMGFTQFYFMSERVPLYYNLVEGGTFSYPIPAYAKNFNYRMGVNICFGYNRNKKLLKDKPLVEE
jgi:hypothetical protein